MTIQNQIKNYLIVTPENRERRNRAKAVWDIFIENHKEIDLISRDRFVDYAFAEFNSINRLIRKVQQDYPYLRGKDYQDKIILEQATKIELGYEPGFNNDISRRVQQKLI